MTLVAPAAGRRARAAGNEITFKIGPDSGAEDLSLFESVVPPGGKVFPHRHRDFEEAFYVLDGELAFLLDAEWHAGPKGTVVHVPREVTHAFQNRSDSPVRVVVIHTPAGAIRMIEELAQLAPDSPPAASAAVLARHASEPSGAPPVRGA